jgi:hypothetical protein
MVVVGIVNHDAPSYTVTDQLRVSGTLRFKQDPGEIWHFRDVVLRLY